MGAMAGYHAAVAIHPGTGYGVVVLMGGRYPDAAKLAYDTFGIMQPAVDAALADMATDLYVGEWRAEASDHGEEEQAPSGARIVIERGTLYLEGFVLLGADVLPKFGAPGRLALRVQVRHLRIRCVFSIASRRIYSPILRVFSGSTPVSRDIMVCSTWGATRTGTDRTYGACVMVWRSMRSTFRAPGRSGGCTSRLLMLFCGAFEGSCIVLCRIDTGIWRYLGMWNAICTPCQSEKHILLQYRLLWRARQVE